MTGDETVPGDHIRQHHARVGELFTKLRELPPAERGKLLEAEPDESVREQVQGMLDAESEGSAALSRHSGPQMARMSGGGAGDPNPSVL